MSEKEYSLGIFKFNALFGREYDIMLLVIFVIVAPIVVYVTEKVVLAGLYDLSKVSSYLSNLSLIDR